MKYTSRHRKRDSKGSILFVVLIVVLIVSLFLASVGAFVSHTSHLTQQNNNLTKAMQFAEGGAVIAVQDLNTAVTNSSSTGSIGSKLTGISWAPYTLNTSLGGGKSNVYVRTIQAGAPFPNQTISVQIWMTNLADPDSARIVSTATVGSMTQTATVNAGMGWFGAAILSVNDGSSDTGANAGDGKAGNVALSGGGQGPLVAYGGSNGLAVLANGRVNLSSTNSSSVDVPANSISQTNYATGTPIPDYTDQGTSNALFDINRFIAVANATKNGFAPSHNNHFTNCATFIAAATSHLPNNPMQGVIVVDVSQNDNASGKFDVNDVPNGINVEGTLLFNFVGPGWTPNGTKIVFTCPINVNPANLSGLNPTNPATYPSGWPPAYTSTNYSPSYINISPAYQNFSPSDDLPALIYTIGVMDMHGDVNISGVVYTPSYIELENKQPNQVQYINGQIIMGNGFYFENNQKSTSIIAFNESTVQNLTTAANAGKTVIVQYWQ